MQLWDLKESLQTAPAAERHMLLLELVRLGARMGFVVLRSGGILLGLGVRAVL